MAKKSPSSKARFHRCGKRDTGPSIPLDLYKLLWLGPGRGNAGMPWRHLSALVADCYMTRPPGQATSTGIGGTDVSGALLTFSVHQRNEPSLQRCRPRTTIWPGIIGVVGFSISRMSHRNPFHCSTF
jgi:hypothetical protein